MGAENVAKPTSEPRPAIWKYAYWLLIGALAGLGIESLLTIGLLFLLAAGGLALVGIRAPSLRNRAATAIPAGAGLAVLYLAWVNRGGPGRVCETTGTETSCHEAWSPWPFVAVAVIFIAASVFLALRRQRRRH
ncbi:hypothetical protein [Streptomyces sp. MZ04]|uniref:hypothetical protein n=1 Tax=Streptomyces sp. MZ04 TaxID=2559236 RepID=UPI00107E692B|nr:hypothetical protein [Streptomyces sp. MZ04]TGB14621.1 hypothetical protein E2651_05120 [Streptomyces sp. MZ04]